MAASNVIGTEREERTLYCCNQSCNNNNNTIASRFMCDQQKQHQCILQALYTLLLVSRGFQFTGNSNWNNISPPSSASPPPSTELNAATQERTPPRQRVSNVNFEGNNRSGNSIIQIHRDHSPQLDEWMDGPGRETVGHRISYGIAYQCCCCCNGSRRGEQEWCHAPVQDE